MLIISAKIGQLGNRLLLFANIIAFAIENNMTVINPAFEEYAKFFEPTSQDLFCCYPAKKSFFSENLFFRKVFYRTVNILAWVLSKLKLSFSPVAAIRLPDDEAIWLEGNDFLNFAKQKQIVLLQGWQFQSSSFTKHAEQIRAYFTPLECHRLHVASLISEIRCSCDILIGVHIRQGDYSSFAEGKWFYQTAQYAQFMRDIKRLFPDKIVAFLICSNSQQNKEDFSEFHFTFANNHLIEDMYSLAQCDYIIGPPSTYTMWASFYGEVPLYRIEDPNTPISLSGFRVFDLWS